MKITHKKTEQFTDYFVYINERRNIVYTQQNNFPPARRMEQISVGLDINLLINKYKTPLYNLCFKLTLNRSDADDLFQDTWLKAGKSLSNVDNRYFKQWLFTVCINQYKDNYRKEKRRKDVFYDLYDSSEQKEFVLENTNYSLSAEEEYQSKKDYSIIIQHINMLPSKLKIPMVLHYFQQMKYSEIAQVLKIPEGTVKSRLNAAKKKLKKELNGVLNG